MKRGTAEKERPARARFSRLRAAFSNLLGNAEDPLGAAGLMILVWFVAALTIRGGGPGNRLLKLLIITGTITGSLLMPRLARIGRGIWSSLWAIIRFFFALADSSGPAIRRQPRQGDVAWTWIEYSGGVDDEGNVGKDRPVAVISYSGSTAYVAALTSKDHSYRDDCIPIGSGPWDRSGRPSFVKVDALYPRQTDQLRRLVPDALNQHQMNVILTGLQRYLGNRYVPGPTDVYQAKLADERNKRKSQNVFGWLLLCFGVLLGVIDPIITFFQEDFLNLFR